MCDSCDAYRHGKRENKAIDYADHKRAKVRETRQLLSLSCNSLDDLFATGWVSYCGIASDALYTCAWFSIARLLSLVFSYFRKDGGKCCEILGYLCLNKFSLPRQLVPKRFQNYSFSRQTNLIVFVVKYGNHAPNFHP